MDVSSQIQELEQRAQQVRTGFFGLITYPVNRSMHSFAPCDGFDNYLKGGRLSRRKRRADTLSWPWAFGQTLLISS